MTCDVCGPQPAPTIHTICHPQPEQHRRQGCGHRLADHANGMRCRICHNDCGIDCRPAASVGR